MFATRRKFLCTSPALAAAGFAAVTGSSRAETAPEEGGRSSGGAEMTDPANVEHSLSPPPTTRRGDMLYRKLGRTDEEVSLIGLGGFHIGTIKDPGESEKFIRSAIDRGITFLDNCWAYHEGESEVRMGRALRDGYRDKVFLMTKIEGRTKDSAARQIDESLSRLGVDHVDLLQLHEVIRVEDADRTFEEGGAIEALREAQQKGRCRYLGFTGHKDPFIHMRMLDVARENGVRFDAVQMPVTVMDAHFRSFTHEVLPRLVTEEIAPLAMKTFGNPHIFRFIEKTKVATPIELLHYSMSLPVSVVITGMDSTKLLDQALEAVRTFDAEAAEQGRGALLERFKEAASKGEYERYKTAADYDATARHPEWLG